MGYQEKHRGKSAWFTCGDNLQLFPKVQALKVTVSCKMLHSVFIWIYKYIPSCRLSIFRTFFLFFSFFFSSFSPPYFLSFLFFICFLFFFFFKQNMLSQRMIWMCWASFPVSDTLCDFQGGTRRVDLDQGKASQESNNFWIVLQVIYWLPSAH